MGFFQWLARRRFTAQYEADIADQRLRLAMAKLKMPPELWQAHEHVSHHRKEVLASKHCGCFYCLNIFSPQDIVNWADDDSCALCPQCGTDAVLAEKSGYPISKAFLRKMRAAWFEELY